MDLNPLPFMTNLQIAFKKICPFICLFDSHLICPFKVYGLKAYLRIFKVEKRLLAWKMVATNEDEEMPPTDCRVLRIRSKSMTNIMLQDVILESNLSLVELRVGIWLFYAKPYTKPILDVHGGP